MSKFADITAEIKSILEDINGIGIVHDRFRSADDAKELLELFKYEDEYKGVMFRRVSETPEDNESAEYSATYELMLVHQLNDENNSEHAVQELYEGIKEAFADSDLSDCKISMSFEDAPIGDILCHIISIQLELQLNNL